MVKEKIEKLLETKTIIHIDNPDHYNIIKNYTTLTCSYSDIVKKGNFCINLDEKFHHWAELTYYKQGSLYKDYLIITSSELLYDKIYELW